jgi:hypothetical protein
MEEPRDLQELRADVEARQRNTLWEDARRGGQSVDAFLWKGDPHAKPIQRAGLVVFGVSFLLLAVAIISIPFQRREEPGWGISFFLASLCVLISLRLFRNACLRSGKSEDGSQRNPPA